MVIYEENFTLVQVGFEVVSKLKTLVLGDSVGLRLFSDTNGSLEYRMSKDKLCPIIDTYRNVHYLCHSDSFIILKNRFFQPRIADKLENIPSISLLTASDVQLQIARRKLTLREVV